MISVQESLPMVILGNGVLGQRLGPLGLPNSKSHLDLHGVLYCASLDSLEIQYSQDGLYNLDCLESLHHLDSLYGL